MGPKPKIVVTIDEEGKVTMDVQGGQGKSCEELTKPLEEALGGNVASREHKPEYNRLPGATKALGKQAQQGA